MDLRRSEHLCWRTSKTGETVSDTQDPSIIYSVYKMTEKSRNRSLAPKSSRISPSSPRPEILPNLPLGILVLHLVHRPIIPSLHLAIMLLDILRGIRHLVPFVVEIRRLFPVGECWMRLVGRDRRCSSPASAGLGLTISLLRLLGLRSIGGSWACFSFIQPIHYIYI